MAGRTTDAAPARHRSLVRAIAVPSEHGGWALTVEPVLLGLLVAPSVAGGALGAAAVLAFLARTPLRVVLVDRWRRRRLRRTVLAERVAAAELAVVGVLVAVAALRTGPAWWAPLLAAAPLVAVGLWFDMRSRSRRLVPELCGAVGIASVAAAIARAGGEGWSVSIGLWIVLSARSLGSVPFARAQVQRIKGHYIERRGVDLSQALALVTVVAGWAVGAVPVAALVAVGAAAACQLWWVRVRPPKVVILGVAQLVVGVAIVLATAGNIRFG